jgi:glycosyltransferase involved in cell wall biosynthesis
MKIVVVTSSYPRFPGDGTAPFVRSLAENLAELGHEIHVLAPYDPAVRKDDHSSISVHRFRYVWTNSLCMIGHAKSLKADVRLRKIAYLLIPLYLLCGTFALIRLARKSKFDLVHVHWVLPNGPIGAIGARLLHLPLIITLHGSDIFMAKRNPIFRLVARFAFSSASATTACSPELEEHALQIGGKSLDTFLIPWGADPQIFAPRDATELRIELGIEPEEVVVMAMGRLVYKKGLEYLIRAVHQIPTTIPWRLVIVGDGDLRGDLERLAQELGIDSRVLFVGQIPWHEAPHYLNVCDIFVMPSIHDHFGNLDGLPTVILEAMATGKPVIGTNIAGIPLVIRDGVNGFLVPEKSSKHLSSALEQLLTSSDLRAKQGAAGRCMVKQQLNWKQIAQNFQSIFQETIERAV